MDAADRTATQCRRAGVAATAVAALVAAVLIACLMGGRAAAEAHPSVLTGEVWDSLRCGHSVADALAGAGLAEVASDQVPDWFTREVLAVRDGWRVCATKEWDVVDIGCEGALQPMRAEVEEQFAARGWMKCPTGVEGQDTYMKDEGACTWMMAGFSETGGAADAVLRIHRA